MCFKNICIIMFTLPFIYIVHAFWSYKRRSFFQQQLTHMIQMCHNITHEYTLIYFIHHLTINDIKWYQDQVFTLIGVLEHYNLFLQWEYQVGPCEGVAIGDHLYMSRYILHRLAETFGVRVSFKPVPLPGVRTIAGGHLNFSTVRMREEGGIRYTMFVLKDIPLRHMNTIMSFSSKFSKQMKALGITRDIVFVWCEILLIRQIN